jgi:hypothetical protein
MINIEGVPLRANPSPSPIREFSAFVVFRAVTLEIFSRSLPSPEILDPEIIFWPKIIPLFLKRKYSRILVFIKFVFVKELS